MPRIPDAGTIPQIAQQPDPGLTVPASAFGGQAAEAFTDLGARVAQIADRQISRQEAVDHARFRSQFNLAADEELRRLSTEDDLSRSDVIQGYGEFLATKQAELLGEYGGRASAAANLQADLTDLESRYRGQAAALSTKVGLEHIQGAMDEQLTPLASEAAGDPARLDDLLLQADRMVATFAPALSPGQEQSVRSAARETVARSAIDAALQRGDVDTAEQMLDVGGLSSIISPETQSQIRRQIGTTRSEQHKLEQELAQAEAMLGRPLTQTEIATKLGLVRTPAANINVVPQVGAPPAGWQNVLNDQGQLIRQEPIPGGPADIKAQREQVLSAAAKEDEITKSKVAVRDIDRSLALIEKGAGGAQASLTAQIPGTDSFNLDRQLDSVKARVGFDTLQKMRASSPTGGALGQVSERENILLQSALGSLDVRQDPQTLAENLRQIRELQLDAWYGTPAEHERAIADGKMTEDEAAELQRQRATVGFDAIGRQVETQEAGSASKSGTAASAPAVQPATSQRRIDVPDVQAMTPEQADKFVNGLSDEDMRILAQQDPGALDALIAKLTGAE